MNAWEELFAAAQDCRDRLLGTKRLADAVARIEEPTLLDQVEEPPELKQNGNGSRPFDPAELDALEPDFDVAGLDENSVGGWRATDPDTSREAAVAHYSVSAGLRRRVFWAVLRADGLACFEVIDQLGLPHETVSPRFAQLAGAGCLRKSDERRVNPRTNRSQIIWQVTGEARAEAARRGWLPKGDEG